MLEYFLRGPVWVPGNVGGMDGRTVFGRQRGMRCMYNARSRGKIIIRSKCRCGSGDIVGRNKKCRGENDTTVRSRN